MVSNTAPCRHLQGLGHHLTATLFPLHQRPIATRSPTHAVSRYARQPLPCRQQTQVAQSLRKSAAGCATCCAAAVGGKACNLKRFQTCQLVCQAELFCAAAVEQLVLQPIKRIEGHVKLPGSKSLSNRILLLAALSEGTTQVQNLLVSAYLEPCKLLPIEYH